MAGIQSSINQAVGIASALGTQTGEYKRKQEIKGLKASEKGIEKGLESVTKAEEMEVDPYVLPKIKSMREGLNAAKKQAFDRRVALGGATEADISYEGFSQYLQDIDPDDIMDVLGEEKKQAYAESQEALREEQLEKKRKRSVFEQQFMKNFEQARDEEAKR